MLIRQKKVLFVTVIVITAVFNLLFFGCESKQESRPETEVESIELKSIT
jgi:hypothetical protein